MEVQHLLQPTEVWKRIMKIAFATIVINAQVFRVLMLRNVNLSLSAYLRFHQRKVSRD
jgi:hypothetical protein